MKKFGSLSFGHYSGRATDGNGYTARNALQEAVELAKAADKLGVNGAYLRVHHYLPQHASPIPLLSAMAAVTENLEVGTGVIDMRYENPLYLAEEAAALDLLSNGRVALGVPRGSPEAADRGWESFGYTGSTDPRGADIAHQHFDTFLRAVRGEPMATAAEDQYPAMYRPGAGLPVMPQSPGLDRRIWWGAGRRETAEWAAEQGVNLMSSTLLTEATGEAFADLQAQQLQHYHEAWKRAGHDWTPRMSVSRTIFPIIDGYDRKLYLGGQSKDGIGVIDGVNATFGKTYAAEPDQLVEQLRNDAAVMDADTLMLTIPSQLGVEANKKILKSFALYVAPELGWEPANQD